jgi:hypothetical protein
MTLFFELLGMGAIAIVVFVVPLSYLMAKLLVHEPPTAAEWLRVVGFDENPVVARKFATAFTSAVTAENPMTVAATTLAIFAVSEISQQQVMNLQHVDAPMTNALSKVM